MTHFVDRRLNPKERSLGNRRRFIKRVRNHVKNAVDRAVRERGIADAGRSEEKVTVPADGLFEPHFRDASESGHRERVLPGNKTFRAGDLISKPPAGGGGSGRRGSPDGEGEDDFTFVLSREEFLDLFFEDLELPDLIKRSLKSAASSKPRRAGHSVTGSPANLSVPRTMRNALGRRIALRRPSSERIAELRDRIAAFEAHDDRDAMQMELAALRAELEELLRRQRLIPYLDPLDLRYNYFESRPEPNSSAVMFCLMDVSASMQGREKDLAKRFFILLHLFLTRRYDRVDLVFIRHTHVASEVDEDTFFHSRDTGGTIVSSALIEMRKIIAARYPAGEWNIYVAQASDGDNYAGDSQKCAELLREELLGLCQYFAYVEIIGEQETSFLRSEESGTELWTAYRGVAAACKNIAMKRIATPSDIYPVFRELFARKSEQAHG